jgi:hypothetical protein
MLHLIPEDKDWKRLLDILLFLTAFKTELGVRV